MKGQNGRACAGFSLIELILSMAVLTMVMMGLCASVFLAFQAMPTNASTFSRTAQVEAALGLFEEEAQYALFISEREPQSITFTISDRDGDSIPDVVRYSWSGVEGDPLQRTFNGVQYVVLDDPSRFVLGYDITGTPETFRGAGSLSGPVELAEAVVSSYDRLENSSEEVVKSDVWWGQRFTLSDPPAESTSWRMTGVRLRMNRKGASNDQLDIELRTADTSGMPTSTVLGSVRVYENTLPPEGAPFTWLDYDFDIPGLDPDETYVLVLRGLTSGDCAAVEYASGGVSIPGGAMIKLDPGPSETTDKAIFYEIYGAYTVDSGAGGGEVLASMTRAHDTAINVCLEAGNDSDSRISHRFTLSNNPEVLSGYWTTNFAVDPTLLDINADGIADWAMDSGSLDPTDVINEAWHPDNQALRTWPANDLNGIVTVDAAVMDDTANGQRASFSVSADRIGSDGMTLYFHVNKVPPEQIATLELRQSNGSMQLVGPFAFPMDDPIDVRLLIDPPRNLLNVQLDGVDQGGFLLQRDTSPEHAGVEFLAQNNQAGPRFDDLSVRLGGFSNLNVLAGNLPPQAIAGASKLSATVGESIVFDATDSDDPNGDLLTHAWDFGDDSNTLGETVSHSYATPGIKVVTLTSSDIGGGFDTDIVFIVVSE